MKREEDHSILVEANQSNNKVEQSSLVVDPSLEGRLGFIRKVYGILTTQLVVTGLFTYISIHIPSLAKFEAENLLLLILCVITVIIVACMLFCCKENARKVPKNYILLSIFTICEAYLVSASCCQVAILYSNGIQLVSMALIMTIILVVGLTIYAFTTKSDYSICTGILWSFLICLFIFSLFLIFTDNKFLHIFYCILCIFLFSIYLICDTQLVVGGHTYELTKDDYIIGAIILYIDIIRLFLEILKLLALVGGKKN